MVTKKKTVTKKINRPIKSIAVLCSGGDAPGMNAAIRAVVRTGIGMNLKVYGIRKGFAGLLEGQMDLMNLSSVGNIIQRGGTILQTSRCAEFHRPEIRKEAAHIMKRKGIDGLVVIGGDGSFNGAMKLHLENNIPVVGIPGTIDNDIEGTEYTIGFDTAVQNAVQAVDNIRDTASSHERTFIVEVMGRSSPNIALKVGLCTGAENIIFPYKKYSLNQVASDLKRGVKRGKSSSILIVAESSTPGFSYEIQSLLLKKHKIPSHVCILGHIQRGGTPTAVDRFTGTKMGFLAVKALIANLTASATIYQGGVIQTTELKNCLKTKKDFDDSSLELVKLLSI